MIFKFKSTIMVLAVLAVALVQIFGMRAGYICACTGAPSATAQCEPETCHPDELLVELAELAELAAAPDACTDGCGSAPHDEHPAKPGHQHPEVRETLVLAGLPPNLAPPMPVFFDLPPALQLPDLSALLASGKELESSGPPEYGSPPMPLVVARTIVMLV